MWSNIRFRIAQFFCKSSFIWGTATTKFRTVYYYDDSITVDIIRRGDSPLVLYIDGPHVAQITKWLNTMQEESLRANNKQPSTSSKYTKHGDKILRPIRTIPVSGTKKGTDGSTPDSTS